MQIINATLAPHKDKSSIRKELISQDVIDMLVYTFFDPLYSSNIPVCGVEIKLDNQIRNLLFGGDGFILHKGSDSLHYFQHLEDKDWAILFPNDCKGDAFNGKKILDKLEEENND